MIDILKRKKRQKPTRGVLEAGRRLLLLAFEWGFFVLFSVREINTSKCFLVFHLFIPAINILSLKKGSNVCS